MCKLLAFSGSLRKSSYNQSIVETAAHGAKIAGADVTIVHLKDFIAPLYNEDLEQEQGMPATAQAFKDLLLSHDGILVASPEYNSSYSAALKNALDWASRGAEGEKPLAAFRGKTAMLMAASPGALGGLRGLVNLRMLLSNLGMHVHPTQQAFGKVQAHIDEQGKVVDEKTIEKCHNLGAQLMAFTTALNAK